MQGLSKIAALDQIGQAFQELAHMNGGPMQIKKPFREDGDRDDAADQDGPHEQTTLLDVIDHAET